MALGQTDPELLRQLDDAKSSGEPVQAVVKLRRTAGKAPEPAAVEKQTQRAVDRTIEATGERPDDVHVMGRLSVAYVSGSEKFLREFVEQPEVASAVANQTVANQTVANQTSTDKGAASADEPARDNADSADSALGTPVPAADPASGRSNGGTAHRPS
jgi:hypothetical protein